MHVTNGSLKTNIFQVHKTAKQRPGVAEGAGPQRDRPARGANQMRAGVQRAEFDRVFKQAASSLFETRETHQREPQCLQNELYRAKADTTPRLPRGVRQERQQPADDRSRWPQHVRLDEQKERDTFGDRSEHFPTRYVN